MPTIFSYRIAHDDGAAPNPFRGVCTLVICKPKIRRAAQVGDWIVGIGASNSLVADRLVYAMQVSRKMTMAEYDQHVRAKLPRKIPNWRSKDPKDFVGDALYDFSTVPPSMRQGVHKESDREHDLSGRYALLSDRFVYFGEEAIALPVRLRPITDCRRGHRSKANAPYAEAFVRWIESKGLRKLQGMPSGKLFGRMQKDGRSSHHRTGSVMPIRRCS